MGFWKTRALPGGDVLLCWGVAGGGVGVSVACLVDHPVWVVGGGCPYVGNYTVDASILVD